MMLSLIPQLYLKNYLVCPAMVQSQAAIDRPLSTSSAAFSLKLYPSLIIPALNKKLNDYNT